MNRTELIRTFTLANEFKEGDLPVGGTRDEQVRAEARQALAATTLGDIARTVFVEDGLTTVLESTLDRALLGEIKRCTVGEVKRKLLGRDAATWAGRYRAALSSEMIAAAAKIMTDSELGVVCRSIFNPLPGEGIAIGAANHFGSRIQPNSPGDDEDEILLSILEGLRYGCGDVIIGLNPANDDVESIVRLEDLLRRIVDGLGLPTRYCVLSDIVKQSAARSRTKVDVGFQSLGGTSKALSGMVGLDVAGLLDLAAAFPGLYFETGQGSELTNGAAQGVDMVTLESRTYGLARYIQTRTGAWTIVNDVAGFIGPEVFRNAEQLKRACLEDTMMAKVHGLTMGLDVCSTFHMGLGPEKLREVTTEVVAAAAPAYLMAVAGNADPMLGYMTTAFRDHPRLREMASRSITGAMDRRLTEIGITGSTSRVAGQTPELYAAYMKAVGDGRPQGALSAEGMRKIERMKGDGFDIGYDDAALDEGRGRADARIDAIYANARAALYASLNEGVIRNASTRYVRIRSASIDREDYLDHPATGERITPEDAGKARACYPVRGPDIQIVISDGLNANAINENLGSVLPGLRRGLNGSGIPVGEVDIVVSNGRVRAGYDVGGLTRAECVIHLIGERPGTGIDAMSAYITYGLDRAGQSRWSTDLDHSVTTAICGIHRKGKPPQVAVAEIQRCVSKVFELRCSGVELAEQGARL